MTDARYPHTEINGVPVVAAPAEVDITNAEGLRSALFKAAVDRSGALVVDMTPTQFCDCSGLHTLLAAHKRAQAAGRQVLLVISGGAVLRIFTLTGVDQVIPVFTTLAEALAAAAATAEGRSRPRQEGDDVLRTGRRGLPPAGELPGTLKCSSTEAQETFTRALVRAVQVYGEATRRFALHTLS